MSPVLSWVLVIGVVAAFTAVVFLMLAWVDVLLDWRFERRHLRR